MKIRRKNLDEAFERFKDHLFRDKWECECGYTNSPNHVTCAHTQCQRDQTLHSAARYLRGEGAESLAGKLESMIVLDCYRKLTGGRDGK